MTAALALLLGVLLSGWLVPRLLARLGRRADPGSLIAGWLAAMIGVVLTIAAAVALLLLPDHGHGLAHGLGQFVHRCWHTVTHGLPPDIEHLSGLLGAILLTIGVAWLATVAVSEGRRRRRERRSQLSTLRLAASRDDANTLWLLHDRPLAFCIAGRPGVVVATDGLHRHLSPEAVAAVITHERAHLQSRHHLVVVATDLLARCVPFLPLFRRASAAVRELVELAADASAVRTHGREAVHAALLSVTANGVPGTALAMGREGVAARLDRLRQLQPPSRPVRSATTSLGIALLPLLAGGLLLLGVGIFAC